MPDTPLPQHRCDAQALADIAGHRERLKAAFTLAYERRWIDAGELSRLFQCNNLADA